MRLGVRRLHPDARLPARAHPGAGLDRTRSSPSRWTPGERTAVRTGIAIELPAGHAGWVLPRSGLARQHGIPLVNAPGLIDAGYRGELEVLLLNTDREEACELRAGDGSRSSWSSPAPRAEPVELELLCDSAPAKRRRRLQRRMGLVAPARSW